MQRVGRAVLAAAIAALGVVGGTGVAQAAELQDLSGPPPMAYSIGKFVERVLTLVVPQDSPLAEPSRLFVCDIFGYGEVCKHEVR